MIAVVLAAERVAGLAEAAAALSNRHGPGSLVLEVRLDHLQESLPAGFLERLPFTTLLACRRRCDGGLAPDADPERLPRLLAEARRSGADWVDVEEDQLPREDLPPGLKVLASFHDPDRMPEDLEERVRRALELADAAKAAVRVADLADCVRLAAAMRAAGGRLVGLGLGAVGLALRLLAPAAGAPWTYARGPGGAGPGLPRELPALDLMAERYQLLARPRPASVLGVLGDRAAESVGPAVYNPLLREAGLEALYVPVSTPRLNGLRAFMEALGIRGLSVTTPFKEDVVRLAGRCDPAVTALGAANTLVLEAGGLAAWNTDVEGVLGPLRERGLDRGGGRSALVLGAGGAGRAAARALAGAGWAVGIWSRTRSRAERAAADLGVEACPRIPEGWELLVNATPVGGPRAPRHLPLQLPARCRGRVVVEMNYRRGPTPLLEAAGDAGATLVTGAEVFAHQGAPQLALLTGAPAPDTGDLRRRVEAALGATA